MRKLTLGIALLAALGSGATLAQTITEVEKSAPGVATAVETESYSGTISAINAETRMITVNGDGSGSAEINAGPEVKNFAQLKAGDRVTIAFTKALALELRKSSTAEISRSDEAARVQSEAGEAPGGTVGTLTMIMAQVTAIDAANQTVTLQGPNQSIDLKVKDAAQLANIAVGDQVEATYIEALAIQVTPAATRP